MTEDEAYEKLREGLPGVKKEIVLADGTHKPVVEHVFRVPKDNSMSDAIDKFLDVSSEVSEANY